MYDDNESFDTCTADSPVIDLTNAVSPQLSFWRWDHTEGGTSDGWNLQISTDNGNTYNEVPSTLVTPTYNLTIVSEPSWGGDNEQWQNYFADLTAYVGNHVKLRFAFRSDAATVYTGVYLDDIVVAEAAQVPIYLTTPTPLPNVYASEPYVTQMTHVGGASNVVWSIDQTNSVNAGWMSIDSTGALTGTPGSSNVGPVSVVVRVDEQGEPTNFDEQTYTLRVLPDYYFQSFAGTCPNGWTLAGDWLCGAPTSPGGPPTAYSGTQCIGTGMTTDYSPGDTWAATTATSPPINLTGATNPMLSFRMWLDTEANFDGANLQISTDGAFWSVVGNTLPQYNAMISNDGAWSGHEGAMGWQLVQADLTAYANMTVYLRIAFQSDNANNFAGVFIDDVVIK
jgi:hypothetical protein